MGSIESGLRDVRFLDDLSYQDTFVHRLDPRAKVLVTFAFVVSVVSFNRYALSALVPYVFYPLFMMGAGRLPPRLFLKRLLVLSPFVVLIGVFNPLFDRDELTRLGNLSFTGGWVSFAAILVRYCLTVSAALVLIACTGFNSLCYGLERMGVPRVFVVQLLLLYRYLFVLTDEASRMARARALRSFGRGSMEMKVFIPLAGALLIRTMDRAQRIYGAMLARGFDGTIRLRRRLRMGSPDVAFTVLWVGAFAVFRLVNVPAALGTLFLRVYPWLG
jgi:cobalt/nickel transport system permease protein